MKKIICLLLVLVLSLSLVPMTASAADASATFTGPTTVRSGNSITLTFALNGKNVYGMEGKLDFDPDQVTLVSTKVLAEDPWQVDINSSTNKIAAYDEDLTDPINKSTKLFSATFKVKQLAVGTKIKISVKDVEATAAVTENGKTDYVGVQLGDISYSITISAALSTNNKLQELKIANATIVPAFDPNVTAYTAEVPFTVSKLAITAVPADKATVKLSNPTLSVDAETKVTITVTAESGAKKVYTITVTRGQDPDYEPSGNNFLSGIQVDGFYLSPAFDKNKSDYVIWLPYEIDQVSVSGTAEDKKASIRVEGGSDLVAGADNVIKITCIAENGDEKIYTVIAKRAAGHDIPTNPTGTTDPDIPPTLTTGNSTTKPTPPAPTTNGTTAATKPSTGTPKPTTPNTTPDNDGNILLIILYIIIGIIALCGILVCVMFVTGMRRKGRYAKKRKRSR